MKEKMLELIKLIEESNLSQLEKEAIKKKIIEIIEEVIKFYKGNLAESP